VKKIPKRATQKINGGNIQDGLKATPQIANEGEPLSTEIAGNLPQIL